MMNTKHILFFGLTITSLTCFQSCRTAQEAPAEMVEERETMEKEPTETFNEMGFIYRTVAQGYLTGDGQEGIREGGMVINSQAEWNALFTKMNSVNDVIEEQSIDFKASTVVEYFVQISGSGGYTVDIFKIVTTPTKDKLNAHFQKAAPAGDAIEIMTQPFDIVVMKKTELPIVFLE